MQGISATLCVAKTFSQLVMHKNFFQIFIDGFGRPRNRHEAIQSHFRAI